jgi:hypothetical protein
LKRDEFLRELLHRLDIGCRPARVDLDVATLRPPELPEFRPERRDLGLRSRVAFGKGHRDTDPADRVRMLRVRDERPRRRCAEKRDEVASLHESPSRARSRPSLLRYTTS